MNINDMVTVALTPLGMTKITELEKHDVDEHGVLHCELWVLMRCFGPHLYVGAEPFFEKNEIVVDHERT